MPNKCSGDDFIRQLTSFQGKLYAYVLSLLVDPDAAADATQETNVVLWHKADQFTPGTSFTSWALHVAHLQVLAYRQKHLRDRMVFDDDMLGDLSSAAVESVGDLDDRLRALHECIQTLNDRQRDLLQRRYELNVPIRAIARELGQTVNALNQAMHRLRLRLSLCIQRRLNPSNCESKRS